MVVGPEKSEMNSRLCKICIERGGDEEERGIKNWPQGLRLGAEGAGRTEGGWVSDVEVEDSDQRNEGLDGGWGTEERVSLGIGGFTQSTAAREGGWLCLWRWHQNKAQERPGPGSSFPADRP